MACSSWGCLFGWSFFLFLSFIFWLMECSKNQDISHKNPDFSFLLKLWKIWPSCKHFHVCACVPRSLLPIDASFPRAPSPVARLQVCPWREARVAWEGSCADTFSVKGEARPGRSWCQGPRLPRQLQFQQRGQGELWALPQALWLCSWTLVTEDSN